MEKAAGHAMNERLKEVQVGAKKAAIVSKEIERMWVELENQYHIAQ